MTDEEAPPCMEVQGAPGHQVAIRFRVVTEDNIENLKALNTVLFPIVYSENMYRDVLACGDVSQLAYQGDSLVGALASRLQMNKDGTAMLYILTLGVLNAFRNTGVGSELLRRSLLVCESDEVIEQAELHVHISNTRAVRFYERHGFSIAETCVNYYPSLTPSDAVRLTKRLHPRQSHVPP